MMYEVIRTQNGYIIKPASERSYSVLDEVYVYTNFQDMADKLFDLLNPQEQPK